MSQNIRITKKDPKNYTRLDKINKNSHIESKLLRQN